MSPKFQVYKDTAGKTRFRLRADNGKIIAVGEAYEQHAGAINGISSIQKNAGSPTEDLTIADGSRFPNPKYQVFKDARGEFRFHMKAANGEIIAQGEGYESKQSCLDGIEVVRKSADAKIEDPFAAKKSTAKTTPKTEIEETTEPQPLMVEPQTPLAEAKPETPLVETKPESPMQTPPAEPSPPSLTTTHPSEPVPSSAPAQESLTPAAPAAAVETKMVEEEGPIETTLELFPTPANIAKGSHVTLQGRLYVGKSGRGISGAKIHVFERDKSILGDDYLAYGTTGDDGSFRIDWHARSLTWRKSTGDIYAKFNGNEKAKPAKSTVQTITLG